MKSRKGFTLVELLVVIAILAILATASIIGFTAFTRRAEVSNDSELVAQLNKYAQAASVSKDFKTVTEMRDELIESGFELANLKLDAEKQGYVIGFDIKKDRFVLLKGGKAADGYTVDNPLNVFAFVKTEAEAALYCSTVNKFSLYLQKEFTATGGALAVTTGVDVGENNTITSITYDRHDATDDQEVIIRTNDYNTILEITAPNDTVKHYGKAKQINITSISTNSYHEYGDVLGNINLTRGNVVIESGSSASSVVINGDDFANIKANNEANKEVPIIMPMSENAWAADENKSNINPEVNNIIYTKDSSNNDYEVVVRDANGNYSYKTSFESLIFSTMLMNSPDDTIIFLKDVSLDNGMIMIGSNLTLNLNGHTLDLGTPFYCGLTVMDCSLTLMNGTICSDNNIVFLDKNLNPNTCAVNINNVLLQGRGVDGNTSINSIVYGAAGTINIDYSFIELAGNSKLVKAYGEEGNSTIYVKIKISNSKIDAQSTDDVFEASLGEITIDNSVVNLNTPLSNGKHMFHITSPRGLHINSGTFTNASFYTNASNPLDKIVITGGTFDTDVSQYVDTANYNVKENGNTWTVTTK